MKLEQQRGVASEILDLIEWMSTDDNNEYERGILTGLRIAECLAEVVERNSEVSE